MIRSYQGERVPEIHFLHLKVALDPDPQVWRRVRVSNQLTLRVLHHVLQATMGWSNAHRHDFRIGARTYGAITAGDPAGLRDERRARLGKLVAPGDAFRYAYDRERWHHTVHVEGWSAIFPDDPRVLCLEGAGACPPDGGSPRGQATAFDVLRVNAVLAAMWEPRPRSALN